MKIPRLFFLTIFILCGARGTALASSDAARCEIFDGDALFGEKPPESDQYAVTIQSKGEDKRASYVFITRSPNHYMVSDGNIKGMQDRTFSWTEFSQSSEGASVITVKRLSRPFPVQVGILPRSYAERAEVTNPVRSKDGWAVTFEVRGNSKFISIEFSNGDKDNNMINAMMIFVDPLMDVPQGGNVKVFNPGVTEISGDGVYRPEPGIDTVYLARGAWVRGKISAGLGKTANLRILGYGVLDGSRYDWNKRRVKGTPDFLSMVGEFNYAPVLIDGITIVNPSHFMMDNAPPGSRVSHYKAIGWLYNNDGLGLGGDLSDSFIRTNDDCVRVYSGSRVERCVFWQLVNGSCIQLGWGKVKRINGVAVRDCDVIHTEWWEGARPELGRQGYSDNNAILDSMNSGDSQIEDIDISGVRVDTDVWRIFSLCIFNQDKGGYLADITLNDFTLRGDMAGFNQLKALGGPIKNIILRNITIRGKKINDIGRLHLFTSGEVKNTFFN